MISLIKNELIKIFHKKGLYIYGIIILAIFSLMIVFDKFVNINETSLDMIYETREKGLENYDLSNKDEIEWYVDEKNLIDTYKLKKGYDSNSAEYYYIENTIYETIMAMNRAKYIEKDEEQYEMYKTQYDEQVKRLDNFDWKVDVLKEKEAYELEIEELNNSNDNSETVSVRIKELNFKLDGIEYRLKNDVAPSFSNASMLVDNYVSNAIQYESINKDESKLLNNEELMQKRMVERAYNITKYKIDNNIVPDDDMTMQEDFYSEIESSTMFYVIAMVIIAGGIFAEEFNKGTIKQLLVRPFTRAQIYVSKVIAVFVALFISILVFCVLVFIYDFIQYGDISSFLNPIIDYSFKTGEIIKYNTFSYVCLRLIAILPQLIILTLVCIFTGIVSTSTVGAVISVFGLQFVNGLVSSFVSEKITSFLPMNCWDFTSFLTYGVSSNKYGTLGSSLFICVLTMIALYILGRMLFGKKDIKNQ